MNTINIYCDESCHLENDKQPIMLVGGVWCPELKISEISARIKEIKKAHHAQGEIKWTKVSPSRIDFFKEIIEFFFNNPDLHFRCFVVRNKENLNHQAFNMGSHDVFYYKMYFGMLNKILSPDNVHNIYIDIKDTRSSRKVQKLREVLCNNVYDFTNQMIKKIQHIRSEESEIMQIADLLIGAVGYFNRVLSDSNAKRDLVNLIRAKFLIDLGSSTPLSETKFNLFFFTPSEGCNA
jgi:hypothetical protein